MTEKFEQIKIALAEDVPGVRKVLVRMLERLGHQVVCETSNGIELLEECARQDVDVVITDLDMPGMDGLAAAEELADRGIPVILISGHSDAEHVVLEHEPVVARLTKPAALASLQEAVERALTDMQRRQKPR